jgi:hypothetical protein
MFSKSMTQTALIGLAMVAIYKTSRKQVIATGYTVSDISVDVMNYVSKTYQKAYKKVR